MRFPKNSVVVSTESIQQVGCFVVVRQVAYPRWIHVKDRIAQVASELESSSYDSVIMNKGDAGQHEKVVQRWRNSTTNFSYSTAI